jgi:cytochrome c oxidase subunit 2
MITKFDFIYPIGYTFQDEATFTMSQLIVLHDDIMCILLFILGVVFWWLIAAVYEFRINKTRIEQIYRNFRDGLSLKNKRETFVFYCDPHSNKGEKEQEKKIQTIIEVVWTIVPAIILLIMAIPSITFLFRFIEPSTSFIEQLGCMTVKIIGHQWYWTYEYILPSQTENGNVAYITKEFDSYMIPEEMLQPGDLRLLEVDNALHLPVGMPIRLLITSTDVIHSWAVPSLGVKVDAVPGRLNEIYIFIFRKGEFYGQCSELCGVNHGFMPIKVVSTAVIKQ